MAVPYQEGRSIISHITISAKEAVIFHLAYNALAWTIGGITMLVFAYKSWRLYRGAGTSLSSYYTPYCLLLGTGMLVGSLPLMMVDSPAAMRAWYLAGQAILWSSMVWQAQLDWFLMLRPKWSHWTLIVPAGAVSVYIWLSELAATQPQRAGNLILWNNPLQARIGAAVSLSLLILPIVVFYVMQAFSLSSNAARRRALSIALMAFAIYAGEIYIYLGLRGNEPAGLSIFDCVVFTAFLITMLIPRRSQDSKAPATAEQPA